MGNGAKSSLFKGFKDHTAKLSNFTIDVKSARQFNIDLIFHSNSRSYLDRAELHERLNKSLDTVNRLYAMLGMDPNDLPDLEIHYNRHSDKSYGDAVIDLFGNKTARLNLYTDMFLDKNYDTGAHEVTHGLEAWFIKTQFNSISDQANAWQNNLFSEGICRNALVAIGEQSASKIDLDKIAWKKNADTIKLNKYDTYASSQPCETVTRAVQDVLRKGSSASEYSKAILQQLKLEVKRNYKIKKSK